MAALGAPQDMVTGTAINFAAAAGGGDTIIPDDRGVFLVRNADAAAKTVTVASTRTVAGLAVPNRAVTVAAGATVPINISKSLNDALNTGLVAITYSAVTSVTVAYIKR